jgi:hypothetical protein
MVQQRVVEGLYLYALDDPSHKIYRVLCRYLTTVVVLSTRWGTPCCNSNFCLMIRFALQIVSVKATPPCMDYTLTEILNTLSPFNMDPSISTVLINHYHYSGAMSGRPQKRTGHSAASLRPGKRRICLTPVRRDQLPSSLIAIEHGIAPVQSLSRIH